MIIDMPDIEPFGAKIFIQEAKKYERLNVNTSKARFVTFQFNNSNETVLSKQKEQPKEGYHTFELRVNIQTDVFNEVLDKGIEIANNLNINGFQICDNNSTVCAFYWDRKKWLVDIRNQYYKKRFIRFQKSKSDLIDFLSRV